MENKRGGKGEPQRESRPSVSPGTNDFPTYMRRRPRAPEPPRATRGRGRLLNTNGGRRSWASRRSRMVVLVTTQVVREHLGSPAGLERPHDGRGRRPPGPARRPPATGHRPAGVGRLQLLPRPAQSCAPSLRRVRRGRPPRPLSSRARPRPPRSWHTVRSSERDCV